MIYAVKFMIAFNRTWDTDDDEFEQSDSSE